MKSYFLHPIFGLFAAIIISLANINFVNAASNGECVVDITPDQTATVRPDNSTSTECALAEPFYKDSNLFNVKELYIYDSVKAPADSSSLFANLEFLEHLDIRDLDLSNTDPNNMQGMFENIGKQTPKGTTIVFSNNLTSKFNNANDFVQILKFPSKYYGIEGMDTPYEFPYDNLKDFFNRIKELELNSDAEFGFDFLVKIFPIIKTDDEGYGSVEEEPTMPKVADTGNGGHEQQNSYATPVLSLLVAPALLLITKKLNKIARK